MDGTPLTYYAALNRPLLMLGVDKRFLLMAFMIAALLAMSAQFNWLFDLAAVVLFLILHTGLILMYRIDPLIYELYQRHLLYKGYYRAQATIYSPIRPVSPSVPIYQGQGGIV